MISAYSSSSSSISLPSASRGGDCGLPPCECATAVSSVRLPLFTLFGFAMTLGPLRRFCARDCCFCFGWSSTMKPSFKYPSWVLCLLGTSHSSSTAGSKRVDFRRSVYSCYNFDYCEFPWPL